MGRSKFFIYLCIFARNTTMTPLISELFNNDLLLLINNYVETRLVKVVVEVMGGVFPELKHYEAHIRDTIASEELSFGRTLLHVSLNLICNIYIIYVYIYS